MNNQKYTVNEIMDAVRQELAEANKTLKIADGFTDDDYKYLGVIAAAEKRLPEPLPVATGVEEAAKAHQKGNYEWQVEKRKSFIAGAAWQASQSPVSDAVVKQIEDLELDKNFNGHYHHGASIMKVMILNLLIRQSHPNSNEGQICYKSNKPCVHNCSGLCRDSY